MLLDLLQYVQVPLLLYCVPRWADSYSSSSSIYCIVPGVQHGLIPCWCPKAMAHFVIAIAGPRSTATPNTVCDCCFTIAMAIAVVGLHASCSIINNNVNTFSIKTIANTKSSIKTIANTSLSFPASPAHSLPAALTERPCCWRVELDVNGICHYVVDAFSRALDINVVVVAVVADVGRVCISPLTLSRL